MDKDLVIQSLHDSADSDAQSAQSMFENGHYTWALFVWQLVLEKHLKIKVIQATDESAPFTHNLAKLAQLSKLPFSPQQLIELEEISKFNIDARYEDYKREFHRRATKEFTTKWVNIIQDLLLWIKQQN